MSSGEREARARSAADKALERAESLRREKRCDEGIALLSDALKYGVRRAQIYYRLGNLYYDCGNLEHAERAYRGAIEHDAQHINAHHNLGVVYRRQGRIDESLRMRRKASALARDHPERLTINPKQARYLKRYAVTWFAIGAALVGIAALILFFVSWLT